MRKVYGLRVHDVVKQDNFKRRVQQWTPAFCRAARGLNPGLAPRWLALLFLIAGSGAGAQDLEPRRWSQLPTGLNVIGVGATYSSGDVFLDPVLEIEDATMDVSGAGLVYLRTFGLFGRSARVDALLPAASGRWEGLLQGEPASTRREGLSDPRLRLSILLYGGEAQTPAEFAATSRSDTVVGAAVSLVLPWGEYYPDRLINLGENRWILRPQLGITHTRDKWTYELTGSVFIYGDNDDFRSGNELSNDPLWALQAHAIYTFRPGLWASLSSGYGAGAEPSINGVERDVRTANWLNSITFGFPINRQQGIKIAWLNWRTQEDNGIDRDDIVIAWQYVF